MRTKFTMIAAMLLILSACDKVPDPIDEINLEQDADQSIVEVTSRNDDRLKKVIVEGLQQQQLAVDPNEISIDFPHYEANYVFATFLFTTNHEEQIGFIAAKDENEAYTLDDIAAFSIDTEPPFSTIAFFGKIENEETGYKALLSYVNDTNITEIRTSYTDDTVNIMKLKPENRTFLDVVVGRGVTEKAVEGRDDKGEIIYEQTY